jgi:hypothetical protein
VKVTLLRLCLCARTHVRACVRAFVHTHVCMCMCLCACMHLRQQAHSEVREACENSFCSSFCSFFFKDILLRRRVLQRAQKVTSEFVLDPHSYNDAKALYSCISNNLGHLDEVNLYFYKHIKD